jgi:transcriptional regulator with XRE-family HTH domain
MEQQRSFYLKQWREKRGLTQGQLAKLAGISESHVANLERGVKRYNEGNLQSLASALGIKVWELVGRDPGEDDVSLDLIFRDASPRLKRQAERVLRSLVQEDESTPGGAKRDDDHDQSGRKAG